MRFSSGPPIVPSGNNNNLQLFQTPECVVVFTEMIHEARIIPLDGRPHLPPGIRQWLGDSRGRWEDETLVIETTNFTDKVSFSGGLTGRGGSGEYVSFGRALHSRRRGHTALRVHRRGSHVVDEEALERGASHEADRGASLRVRMSRRELRHRRHPPRSPRRRAGGQRFGVCALTAAVLVTTPILPRAVRS